MYYKWPAQHLAGYIIKLLNLNAVLAHNIILSQNRFLVQSIFKIFWGHAPRLPSKGMCCMLSVLHTLSKLAISQHCQTLLFISLLKPLVVPTVYERVNLKPKPATCTPLDLFLDQCLSSLTIVHYLYKMTKWIRN